MEKESGVRVREEWFRGFGSRATSPGRRRDPTDAHGYDAGQYSQPTTTAEVDGEGEDEELGESEVVAA